MMNLFVDDYMYSWEFSAARICFLSIFAAAFTNKDITSYTLVFFGGLMIFSSRFVKSITDLHEEHGVHGNSSEHSLKRTLGAPSLVALGIGAIIGAGLFFHHRRSSSP
jgi:amino acid permease